MLLNNWIMYSRWCNLQISLILLRGNTVSAKTSLFAWNLHHEHCLVLNKQKKEGEEQEGRGGLSPLLTRFCCEFGCLLAATWHRGQACDTFEETPGERKLGNTNSLSWKVQIGKFTPAAYLLFKNCLFLILCCHKKSISSELFVCLAIHRQKMAFALKFRRLHFQYLEVPWGRIVFLSLLIFWKFKNNPKDIAGDTF